MQVTGEQQTANAQDEAGAKYALVDYNKYFDNTLVDNTTVEQLLLGMLHVPTGHIIVCDPLVGIYETNALTRTVAPGQYPVSVCVTKPAEGESKYALAKIAFSPARTVQWEMAVAAGQDLADLQQPDEFLGFPVDAGLACFCDAETRGLYNQFATQLYQNSGASFNIYNDFFAAQFKKNAVNPADPKDIGEWLNFNLPNNPLHNIMMFVSGNGDGAYPCFWGISEQDEVCSLVIDFFVL